MKLRLRRSTSLWVLFLTILYPLMHATRGANNESLEVAIVWPRDGDWFSWGNTVIKIKSDVSPNSGTLVTQVQFFAESNLIGTTTNAPFNLVWQVRLPGDDDGEFGLKVVALDNSGRRAESATVTCYYSTTAPTFPVVEMLTPCNGSVFTAPAEFDFTAEVLASEGDAGPVEFFVDDHSVGLVNGSEFLSATTPPASVVVSNLAEGEHRLRVEYHGVGGGGCYCNGIANTIRVVRLGLTAPRLTPESWFQCEVVTSLPGIKTIVQVSPDLVAWAPISTNQPPGTTFTFTDLYPATNAQAFYRVALPPP